MYDIHNPIHKLRPHQNPIQILDPISPIFLIIKQFFEIKIILY